MLLITKIEYYPMRLFSMHNTINELISYHRPKRLITLWGFAKRV